MLRLDTFSVALFVFFRRFRFVFPCVRDLFGTSLLFDPLNIWPLVSSEDRVCLSFVTGRSFCLEQPLHCQFDRCFSFCHNQVLCCKFWPAFIMALPVAMRVFSDVDFKITVL
jgi:hypothetical protein